MSLSGGVGCDRLRFNVDDLVEAVGRVVEGTGQLHIAVHAETLGPLNGTQVSSHEADTVVVAIVIDVHTFHLRKCLTYAEKTY